MSGGFAEGGLAVMPYLLLRVRRSNIVEDSLQVIGGGSIVQGVCYYYFLCVYFQISNTMTCQGRMCPC